MLEHQPANRPPPGTAIVTDKGLSGEDTEAFFTSPDLGLTLIRPARKRRAGSPVSPELAAPAGRGHHLDPEKPARPRTPRRPRPGRAVGPHRPAAARAQRRHLVQLADRRPHQALPHQLRPLSCPHFPVNDLGCPCPRRAGHSDPGGGRGHARPGRSARKPSQSRPPQRAAHPARQLPVRRRAPSHGDRASAVCAAWRRYCASPPPSAQPEVPTAPHEATRKDAANTAEVAELSGDGQPTRVEREIAICKRFDVPPEKGLNREEASRAFSDNGIDPRACGSWIQHGWIIREGDRRWLSGKGRDWARDQLAAS